MRLRGSEDILWELGLSFLHMVLGLKTRVVRLGGKCLHLLSHLTSAWLIILFKNVHIFTYLCFFYVCLCMLDWKSEENLRAWVLCFHHGGPRDGVQVLGLSGKHLCPLSHLEGSASRFLRGSEEQPSVFLTHTAKRFATAPGYSSDSNQARRSARWLGTTPEWEERTNAELLSTCVPAPSCIC